MNPTIEELLVGNFTFQGVLLAANRWARNIRDENNNFYGGGYWNGKASRINRVIKSMEIVCIKENAVDILHQYGPSPQPKDHEVWTEGNKIAQSQGYLAGFWDGERTDDGINYAYNIIALKDTEGVGVINFINDTKDKDALPELPINGAYPWVLFNNARDWVQLPNSHGEPSQYSECLPLMTGFDSMEGYANIRIGFKK
ncbi:hypothetical protein KPL47_06775 [Clostridium estertheticum]|uniref:hypothetical protein n=1 Tax=Clostridium estertheticum TaxID=238834 RepID=UPI001C0B4B19|nr:hypothetical protein [Clostridium estertheticum]MBU3176070.1 hypothetical protein [Clostridium estertheticum]